MRDRYQYIPFSELEMDEYSVCAFTRIPNVFHLLQTVPALNHLPTMYTVWG